MAQIKVSELTGGALDWAVAICEGHRPPLLRVLRGNVALPDPDDSMWCDYLEYSTDWSQGGPIIERLMNECHMFFLENDKGHDHHCALSITPHDNHHGVGPTPLIAAMRCYVASKLGDTVEVPDELIK